MLNLNLGSSDRHMAGWVSVDIVRPDNAPPDFQQADLAGPWPWDTSSVQQVRAHDIFEHIGDCSHVDRWGCWDCYQPRVDVVLSRHPRARIHVMNELHRVLIPGGTATVEVPDAAKGAGFFQDPTHVTPWTRNTFLYFAKGTPHHTRFAKAYGITAAFRIVDMIYKSFPEKYDETWKITAVLEALK